MARMEKQEKKMNKDDNDLIDKLVGINRVAKVVKGGRRFGFAALVVVGDQRGKVGFGTGKAKEVPEAIKKATDDAKKNMVKVPLKEGRTLHHDMKGHFGAGRVVLRTGETWDDMLRVANAIEITYVAGFGSIATSVPAGIRQGIIVLASHFFENPEMTIKGENVSVSQAIKL